jgi:hypothetical protein
LSKSDFDHDGYDRAQIRRDFALSKELAVTLYCQSTAIIPEQWKAQHAEVMLFNLSRFAIHARRLLEALDVKLTVGASYAPFLPVLNSDCSFTGQKEGDVIKYVDKFVHCLDRIIHSKKNVTIWSLTPGHFNVEDLPAMCNSLRVKTDRYNWEYLSLVGIAHTFLTSVTREVKVKHPSAAIDVSNLDFFVDDSGVTHLVGGAISLL